MLTSTDESSSTRLPGGRGDRRGLVPILFLALVARAALLCFAEARPNAFHFPDTDRYILVARNIAAGRGAIESASVRAGTDPLYPAILSIGIRLGAESDQSIMRWGRIFNALCGIASVAVLFGLARRLVGTTAALIAAIILAVDPILLFFNALVLTETPYTLLLLLSIDALTRVRERNVLRWSAFAGACLGLGALMRSSGLLLPLMLLPVVWYLIPGSSARRSVAAAVFLLSASLSIAPWVVRNHRLFRETVLVRTGGGASLMEALGPRADGGPGMERIIRPPFPPHASEVEQDRICRKVALDWAWEHPAETFSLSLAKLKRTWSVSINASGYQSPLYRWIARLTVVPVFALALIGMWRLRRRPAIVALLLAPAMYFTLVHMVFVGSVRYRVPAMPLVFVLAGASFAGISKPDFKGRLSR